jgi:hypothetical protein
VRFASLRHLHIAVAQKNEPVRTRCSANGIADSKLEHEEEALEGPARCRARLRRRERVSPAVVVGVRVIERTSAAG